jgi:S1-C subfamily serine protease
MPSWVVAMHLWRRRAATVLVLAAVALAGAEAAAAEQGQTKLTPELLNAIVRIEATVPSDARTARYLGTTRRGSGILIDDDGLIVTIGYLVTEATAAEVTGPDGKPVLATVVGFDNESGLGLLRATDRLDAKPVRLGRSSALKESQVVLVASAESAVAAHVVSRRTFAGYWEYLLEDAIFTQPPIEDWGGAALIGADGTLLGVG